MIVVCKYVNISHVLIVKLIQKCYLTKYMIKNTTLVSVPSNGRLVFMLKTINIEVLNALHILYLQTNL